MIKVDVIYSKTFSSLLLVIIAILTGKNWHTKQSES